MKALRLSWRHHPAPRETTPKSVTAIPTGPFFENRQHDIGDLLLWVPRRIDSFLIDDLTGGFGYSHASIDTGEVDLPSRKPVMIEVTIGQTVERKFQDEYPGRPFARIPLSETGIDTKAFVECVKSELGEKYDDIEALTLGEIDDPAKQMCSSLASDCLPEDTRREIARSQRSGLLPRNAVSDHSPSNAQKTKVFVSPNGFAEYYGAPKGKDLREVDFRVKPHPMNLTDKFIAHRKNLKGAAGVGGMLIIGAALALITLLCLYLDI